MSIRLTRKPGTLLLGLWLILTGLLPLLGISLPGALLQLLAVAAGVLIVLGR